MDGKIDRPKKKVKPGGSRGGGKPSKIIWLALPAWGSGFALSLLVNCLSGVSLLSSQLDSLEYETFMMQRFS